MTDLKIGDREIGPGHPAYIIAEIGFNHEGDVDLGIRMIRAAAEAGADAAKFQTYLASGLTVESNPHFDLIKHGELTLADHERLAAAASDAGITFISTPFGLDMVEILEHIKVPAYKIASMDLTNIPLLRLVASKGKPILLSTGMGTIGEISDAVAAIRDAGNEQVLLLHCVSQYPPDASDANLRTMTQIADSFALPVGYSDHVLGNNAAFAAVALGACVIEKHFTTDKDLPGPDHSISADPPELAALVSGIREVEAALGRRCADTGRPDRDGAEAMRRSLHAATDIAAGAVITAEMVKCVRPEGGLPPRYLDSVIGRIASTDIAREQPITLENI